MLIAGQLFKVVQQFAVTGKATDGSVFKEMAGTERFGGFFS
tara:strand:+ start:414 stop:536 length:123 start_codon:yes stop_codon:yes gene_type:complete